MLIRGSIELFGDSLPAVRLPACLAAVAVLGVVARLTTPRGFAFAALLTPVFTLGAVLVTPDTPLLLFWSLYLLWLVNVHERLTPPAGPPRAVGGLWLVGGLILGCGLLGKYTAGLLVPAGGVSFLLLGRGRWRRWAAGYAAHLIAAAVVFSPVVLFNAARSFEPLRFQLEHATEAKGWGPKTFAEFAGVQVLLAGVLPLALLPWAWWRWRDLSADPRLRACLCLYALPLTFFALKSFTGPLEGNWAVAGYVGFWPVAAHWLKELDGATAGRRRAGRMAAGLAFVLPAGCVLAVAAHLLCPLPFVPPKLDRLARMRERPAVLDRLAEAVRNRAEPLPVFTPDYQLAAALRFRGVPAEQEPGITRPSHFTQGGRSAADHPAFVYASTFELTPGQAAGFGPPEVAGEFPLVVRGERCDTYKLWVYRRPPPTP